MGGLPIGRTVLAATSQRHTVVNHRCIQLGANRATVHRVAAYLTHPTVAFIDSISPPRRDLCSHTASAATVFPLGPLAPATTKTAGRLAARTDKRSSTAVTCPAVKRSTTDRPDRRASQSAYSLGTFPFTATRLPLRTSPSGPSFLTPLVRQRIFRWKRFVAVPAHRFLLLRGAQRPSTTDTTSSTTSTTGLPVVLSTKPKREHPTRTPVDLAETVAMRGAICDPTPTAAIDAMTRLAALTAHPIRWQRWAIATALVAAIRSPCRRQFAATRTTGDRHGSL